MKYNALLVGLAVLSGIGYFAYDAGQRSSMHAQNPTNEVASTSVEANAEEKKDVVQVQPKTVEGSSSVSRTPAAPVNNNLDSTCLSFYEKMKSLDIPPVRETPIYTQAELRAIEMGSKGEYDPALDTAMAKVRAVEPNYQNAIRANSVQKQSLATKYAFCYEYLAKTYGFVIQ